MSNVREYRALRTLAGALAAHERTLRVAASAAAFIVLGLTAAQCGAANAESSEPKGVSNAEITADGRKWMPCAAEYGTCRFDGTRDVLYGTVEQHVVKTFSNSAECNNGVFGDPAPGVEKRCAVAQTAANSSAPPAPATAAAALKDAAAQSSASAAPVDLKAPPGQGLRCAVPSSPVRAAANGDLLEADTPSDGTRLFAANQPFALVFTARPTQNDTLNWQIRDSWNVVRASGRFPIAAGPTLSTLSCASTVAGYFAVSASLERAHGQLESRGTRPAGIATFGVLPDLSSALSAVRFPYDDLHRFGGQGTAYLAPGQHCCDGDGYRPVYTALGLSWVNDNRNWYMEEPKKAGAFDPQTKQLTPFFRRGDIMRLIQLDGIPYWVSPTGKETHSYAPTSLAQMKDYMAKVGAESNRVRTTYFPRQRDNYYQVTWEPDADGGLPWRDGDANFIAMYKAVWEGIHQTDPHAVVMGLTYSSVQGNVTWMRRLGPLGIGRYMDGMSVHGYYDVGTTPSHPPERVADTGNQGTVPGALPAAMRALRHELRQYLKPGAPLFATETGISYDIGESYGKNYPGANVLYAQAAVVARTHLILLGEGADMTYVFYLADMPETAAGYGIFFELDQPAGAFGPSHISPKPAALAVAAMTRIFDGTATLGPLKGVPKGVYAYAFRRLGGGKIVTALWMHDNDKWNAKTGFDASQSVDYRLRVDAPGTNGEVTAFDMMGNATSVPYHDGLAALKLSPAPIYVVSSNADVFRDAVTTPEGYVAR
ncbi:hypothetical protein LMG28614_01125 [Paraburkholderia ultramafica]|uniref:Uncharacterized protein n=1 Tax=Paraburkholderia ultramafica TaxID=1544867 RepID=A0A6S7AXD2_9BURK|nr:hypothetical protein [Paraburkholderia ultramafica]CAB3780957.1 hypothetical protein LMG28614_01125 [Paraburkholderia ultramafica]